MPPKEKHLEFLITISQSGIYVSETILDDLKIMEGTVVKVKSNYGPWTTSTCYSKIYTKNTWNMHKELNHIDNMEYHLGFFENYLIKDDICFLGYFEWQSLLESLRRWGTDKIATREPNITIERVGNVSKAKSIKIRLLTPDFPYKIIQNSDVKTQNVVSIESNFISHFLENGVKIDLKRASLTRLTNVGPKRRALLRKSKITNICDLISNTPEDIFQKTGISKKIIQKWHMESTKLLELNSTTISSKIFSIDSYSSSKPKSNIYLIDNDTEIEVVIPDYAELSVKKHPMVESKILGQINENFGSKYQIFMDEINRINLISRDNKKEVKIYGPWIIEMLGFDSSEFKEFYEELIWSIQQSYEIYDQNSVIILIEPQKNMIDPDQLLDALLNKVKLPESNIEDIFNYTKEKLILDTNILIDERLSYSIVKSKLGGFENINSNITQTIIIPNIVTLEIKSMMDRRKPKQNQYYCANRELTRLRALHDLGYISLEYLGETPSIPPIVQQEDNRAWTFMSSLRDEYILKIAETVVDSVIVSSDTKLAISAYIRGIEVIFLPALNKILPDIIKNIDTTKLNEEIERISYEFNVPKIAIKERIENKGRRPKLG